MEERIVSNHDNSVTKWKKKRMTLGLLITVGFGALYIYSFEPNIKDLTINSFGSMLGCALIMLFGVILMISSFDLMNKTATIMGSLIITVGLITFLGGTKLLYAIALIFVAVIIHYLVTGFRYMFCAIVTMIIFVLPFLYIGYLSVAFTGEKWQYLILYNIFSLVLILFEKMGAVVTIWLIQQIWGYREQERDVIKRSLESYMNFLYLLLLIGSNVGTYITGENFETIATINSSFLTAFAFKKVEWKSLWQGYDVAV